MSVISSSLGVVAPAAPPPAPAAAVVRAPELTTCSVWPRSAQVASVVLLLFVAGLLTWHVYGTQRRATRPTALEAGSMAFRVDLNRADRAQLLQLPGVGESLVRRIEEYRADHYGFRSIDELAEIQGIGPLTVERLRHLVYVDPPEGDEERGPTPVVRAKGHATKKEMPASSKPTASKKEDALTEPINVNKATAEELQRLPGIGPAMASRVIEARKKAPFKSVDELRHVSGIGPKTLDKLRPHVTVGGGKDQAGKKE